MVERLGAFRKPSIMNSCPAKTAKKSRLKTDAFVPTAPSTPSTANASGQPFAQEAANETNALESNKPLGSSTSRSQSRKSKRSHAWHFFETVAPGKAACQVCILQGNTLQKPLAYADTTGGLIRHLKDRHNINETNYTEKQTTNYTERKFQ